MFRQVVGYIVILVGQQSVSIIRDIERPIIYLIIDMFSQNGCWRLYSQNDIENLSRYSFDVNDAIQNSLGAAIGFGAYKLGNRTKNVWVNMAVTVISLIVLLIGVWGFFGIVDKAFTKEEGPFVAINELKDSAGNTSTGTKLYSFKVSGQNVKPEYNLFGVVGKKSETYTYTCKKQLVFSFFYGIPDQTDDGSISISVDGREVLSGSGKDQRSVPELFPQMFEIPVEPLSKITIIIEGNQKIWDVGFREMKYFWN